MNIKKFLFLLGSNVMYAFLNLRLTDNVFTIKYSD